MSYTILDNSSISSKNLYDLIDSYFESPILEKTQNQNNSSIYMCKIKTLLASPDQRYIVATTQLDNNPLGMKLPLSNIIWKSFQTRSLSNVSINLPLHKYSPKNESSYTIPVSIIKRFEDHTDYLINNFNSTVTLLHKNKNVYEYPSNGNLASCIETYRTIIVL
jgi:hypothetical protein